MRQLGARLPVPPPVETDVQTPSEIQPHERWPVQAQETYPVEVHRIERKLLEPEPPTPARQTLRAKARNIAVAPTLQATEVAAGTEIGTAPDFPALPQETLPVPPRDIPAPRTAEVDGTHPDAPPAPDILQSAQAAAAPLVPQATEVTGSHVGTSPELPVPPQETPPATSEDIPVPVPRTTDVASPHPDAPPAPDVLQSTQAAAAPQARQATEVAAGVHIGTAPEPPAPLRETPPATSEDIPVPAPRTTEVASTHPDAAPAPDVLQPAQAAAAPPAPQVTEVAAGTHIGAAPELPVPPQETPPATSEDIPVPVPRTTEVASTHPDAAPAPDILQSAQAAAAAPPAPRITEVAGTHINRAPDPPAPPRELPAAPRATEVAGTHRATPPAPDVLQAATTAAPPPPVGRWEEFHEFRRLEPGRGGRLSLGAMPPQQGASSDLLPIPSWGGPSRGLLGADREPEHRSSFLTLAVPGIAAVLAVGALLWSGSLRDRVRQQDAAMSALQQQNQKLADTLAQMSVEEKASSALSSNADATSATPQQMATTSTHPAASGGQAAQSDQPASGGESVQKGAVAQSERQPGNQTENRQGVATPPAVQQGMRAPRQQRGSQHQRPVDAGYAPEIVPPYPTNFKPENVAANAANSQPVPGAGTYRAPFTPGAYQQPVPVTASDRSATTPAPAPASHTSAPQISAASQLPAPQAANNNALASNSYDATRYDAGIGSNANLLARNIETVEGLQRHSTVPLQEFHARAGMLAKATPSVQLSVERPDPGHGTYALVVHDGGSSYQLRGEVNHAVVFTDKAVHREYELVVLSIADQQVYGYVRPAQ